MSMFGLISASYERRSLANKPTLSSFSQNSQLQTISSPQDISLQQKVNRIALMNLKDHDLDICACEDCIYSRQLNRKRRINLDLSKQSSYRQQYDRKSSPTTLQQSPKINYQTLQRDKHSKSLVVGESNYNTVFHKDAPYDKPIKNKPDDELKFVGPSKVLSAYEEQYPSFRNNANPYVKPVQVSVPNNLKMNTKSSYQSNYNGIVKPASETGKIPDQLHIGLPWTGGSTYKQSYLQPVSSQVMRYDQSRERRSQISNFKHQYETTYRNEYLLDGKRRCKRGDGQGLNPLLASLTTDV